MQWGCTTKLCDTRDLKAIAGGTRESAWIGEGKKAAALPAFLLWRALATIWPKRLPNVGSLFHAVPRGDQFLPKDLAKPKIFLWPRITPELSRPARCGSGRSETAKRARLERIVRHHSRGALMPPGSSTTIKSVAIGPSSKESSHQFRPLRPFA